MPGRISTKLGHNDGWVVDHQRWSKMWGPRSHVGRKGPFSVNTQNATSPTDSMIQFWEFFIIVLWVWYLRGVQDFGAHGPAWAIWAILWNRTKCYFSYRLYGTMLRVCHDSAPVVLPSGCSGILGPRSRMGHMGHFMKSGPYLFKCFFPYRLYCTIVTIVL